MFEEILIPDIVDGNDEMLERREGLIWMLHPQH